MLRRALSKIRRISHLRGQRGATIVVVAALMVVLLGAVALVADVGMVMAYRTQLQKATDASALAAAQELPNTSSATSVFNDYMGRNLPDAKAVSAPEATLTFSGNPAGTMKVECTQEVSLWFARVLGKESTTIKAVSAAQRTGPDLMLLIDRSGSMCQDYPGQNPQTGCPTCPPCCNMQPMTDVKNASIYFVNQLAGETLMGVVSYNSFPSCDVRLKYLKNEAANVVAGISKLQPGRPPNQYTDIGNAMKMGIDSLLASGRPNPKIMVLITDGWANCVGSHYYGRNASQPRAVITTQTTRAASKGVMVYVVAFGSDINETLLKQIVATTHGLYFRAPTADDMYSIFHQIASYDFVRLVSPA